jgi:hypothetical protein
VEVLDRGVDVHQDPVVVEVLVQRDHLGEIVVRRSPAAGAMEQMRRNGVVPDLSEPTGDVLDVLVHAERLLDDDNRAPRVAPWSSLVDLHRSVGGRKLQRAGVHERSSSSGCLRFV